MLPALIARAVSTATIPDSVLAHIELSLFQLTACSFTIVAGFIIYFWDILITLDDEVNFVWTRGGIFVKLLYTINRYLPFPGLLMMIHGTHLPVRFICSGLIGAMKSF
ncbi:hypothetical protein CPB86DRAFT_625501 [Serendipita vermifera]|nr:hypothetical protein CPB86DRAFT_625501 [Serendipita vermifera]